MKYIYYLSNFGQEPVKETQCYRFIDKTRQSVREFIEENDLLIIANSGMDGNDAVGFCDLGYSEDFKKNIEQGIIERTGWTPRVRFIAQRV